MISINKGVEGFNLISVDNVEEICYKCSNPTYPSLFSTLKGEWLMEYVCIECILSTCEINRSELMGRVNKFGVELENIRNVNNLSLRDWVTEGTEKNTLLNSIIHIEKEDQSHFGDDIITVAQNFEFAVKNNINSANIETLLSYVNFFDNPVSMILKLRTWAIRSRDDKDNFYRSIYVFSRYHTLSEKQVNQLCCNKEFAIFNDKFKFIWDCLSNVVESLKNSEEFDEQITNDGDYDKMISIVMGGDEKGFITLKQLYFLKYFFNRHNLLESTL